MEEDNVEQIARLLKGLKPGFLPYAIFEQIARLVALPIIEFVPLKQTEEGGVQVLLIERDHNDPLWPGLLHTPGTVIRATDIKTTEHENWPALKRILDDELKGTEVGSPHYAGSVFHQSKRGAEQAQLYWVEVRGEPKIGSFWDITKLPDSLMESQRDFIVMAAQDFQKHK